MNRENMERLIAHLESIPDKAFHMCIWAEKHECGTVACIAGYAMMLFNPNEWNTYINRDDSREARDKFISDGRVTPPKCARTALGLDLLQADDLFYPSGWYWKDKTSTDRATAIEVLREVMEGKK